MMIITKRNFIKLSTAGVALTLLPTLGHAEGGSGIIIAILAAATKENPNGAFKVQLSKSELSKTSDMSKEEWASYLSKILASKAQKQNGKVPRDLGGAINKAVKAYLGGGGGAGKAAFQDLSVTKYLSDSDDGGWEIKLSLKTK